VQFSSVVSIQTFSVKNANPFFYAKYIENGYFPLPSKFEMVDQKKLDTLRTKLEAWTTQTNILSKKIQKTQHWHVGTLTQILLGGGCFFNFGENVKVVHLGEKKSSSNTNTRNCRIEGDSFTPTLWKYVAKIKKGDIEAEQ
jgi:hypothetical protein